MTKLSEFSGCRNGCIRVNGNTGVQASARDAQTASERAQAAEARMKVLEDRLKQSQHAAHQLQAQLQTQTSHTQATLQVCPAVMLFSE